MADKKTSSIDDIRKLEERINKDRQRIAKLKEKRLIECGKLLVKYKLHELDDAVLEKNIAELADKLLNGD